MYRGGGPESGRKKFEKCLPAGTGTKIILALQISAYKGESRASSAPASGNKIQRNRLDNFILIHGDSKTSTVATELALNSGNSGGQIALASAFVLILIGTDFLAHSWYKKTHRRSQKPFTIFWHE